MPAVPADGIILSGKATDGASTGFGSWFPDYREDPMLARDADSALKHTPLHELHLARGGRMVPFAGYDMPVQYAAGVLREHLHTRSGRRPVRRLAYGPDRAAPEIGPDRRMPPWRWSGWCRGYCGPAAGTPALCPVHQRRRRHSRRSDGRQFRRPSVFGRQCRLQGRRRGPSARASVACLRDRGRWPIARCWRCKDRRPRRCWRRSRRAAAMRFMDAAPPPRRWHRVFRLALRLYRRGRLRDLSAGRAGRSPGARCSADDEVLADRPGRPR